MRRSAKILPGVRLFPVRGNNFLISGILLRDENNPKPLEIFPSCWEYSRGPLGIFPRRWEYSQVAGNILSTAENILGPAGIFSTLEDIFEMEKLFPRAENKLTPGRIVLLLRICRVSFLRKAVRITISCFAF